jgi:hypothetical protein
MDEYERAWANDAREKKNTKLIATLFLTAALIGLAGTVMTGGLLLIVAVPVVILCWVVNRS